MSAKKAGSGLGARMAASPANAVAAGFAAATGADLPEALAKGEVVAINIRLPKALHRKLRQIAFDEETSINAMLIEAAEKMLNDR